LSTKQTQTKPTSPTRHDNNKSDQPRHDHQPRHNKDVYKTIEERNLLKSSSSKHEALKHLHLPPRLLAQHHQPHLLAQHQQPIFINMINTLWKQIISIYYTSSRNSCCGSASAMSCAYCCNALIDAFGDLLKPRSSYHSVRYCFFGHFFPLMKKKMIKNIQMYKKKTLPCQKKGCPLPSL